MNRLSDLTALRERVAGLTGPDREVDALILALSEDRAVRYENGKLFAKSNHAPFDECVLGTIDPGKTQRNFTPASSQPAYTSSLDAITALIERVLPRWCWKLVNEANYRGIVLRNAPKLSEAAPAFSYSAATIPLAATLALLDALIAQEAKAEPTPQHPSPARSASAISRRQE